MIYLFAIQTSLIKNLLEKLSTLQHTVDMLPDNAPQRDRCQCINQPIICIKEDLKKLLDQVECAVTFLTLQVKSAYLVNMLVQTLKTKPQTLFYTSMSICPHWTDTNEFQLAPIIALNFMTLLIALFRPILFLLTSQNL